MFAVPRLKEEIVDPWGSLAVSLGYLGSSWPVRDPVSKTEVDVLNRDIRVCLLGFICTGVHKHLNIHTDLHTHMHERACTHRLQIAKGERKRTKAEIQTCQGWNVNTQR